MTEMRENNIVRRSDRSYLCLVAIYVIHAILLNVVFLQPNFDNVRNSVTLSSSYIINGDTRELTISVMKNFSENVITKIEGENLIGNIIVTTSNRTNSTVYVERRKNVVLENENDSVYSVKSSRNAFSQSKSGGSAIHFHASAQTSRITRLANSAINTAKSVIERLSPAELGIISGCLVFLLTFTENDYV